MGGVVSVIVTMLLLLSFLDDPFHSGVGGLQPEAMERTELSSSSSWRSSAATSRSRATTRGAAT